MHIKTINYQRTFKLERYLGESYRYETLTLGCEVETENLYRDPKEQEAYIGKAFELARNAVKEQLKLAITQAKEAQKKQEAK